MDVCVCACVRACVCLCVKHWSMIQTGKNQSTVRKTRCIATLSTTNPKWIGMASNLDLHGDRLKYFWPVPMLWSQLHSRQFNLRDLSMVNIFSLHTHNKMWPSMKLLQYATSYLFHVVEYLHLSIPILQLGSSRHLFCCQLQLLLVQNVVPTAHSA